MRMRLVGGVLSVLCVVITFGLGCGDSTTEPEPEKRPDPVAMTGALDAPWTEETLSPESVTVAFAGQDLTLGEGDGFSFSAYPDGPGLLLATDENSDPVLMSVVPHPAAGGAVQLDARSTALSLLFMMPGITTSDPVQAEAVLSKLAATPGFGTLVNLLETTLADDPQGLTEENAYIDQALGTVINNYCESILNQAPGADPSLLRPTGEIHIDPSYEKGGLRVSYQGASTYEVSNAIGRWAQAVPSTDPDDGAFWVFPNGVLVDWIKPGGAGVPFPPSKRPFKLEVALDTEETLDVYGIGFHPAADNDWSALTPEEQTLAIEAGVATALLEFVPHVLSMVGNAGRTTQAYVDADLTDTSLKFDNKVFKVVSLIMKSTRIVDRVKEYIEADNISGLMWFTTKAIFTEISTNPTVQTAVADLFGQQVASSVVGTAISRLNRFAVFPILLGNSYASVMKTVLGAGSGRYKTTFTVSHIISEFGNVTGTVHEKSSGVPLEGVTVQLLGEVNNPLEPNLTDVTNSSGAYFFENLTTGDKQVQASKEGYLSATVDVRVVADQTVTAPLIELGQPSGSAYGTVRDKIFINHNVQDTRFAKTLTLEAREVGGGTRSEIMVLTGEYSIDLAPGTYWLVARHEHYFPDSVQVTVTDGSTAAERDLVMNPKGSMEGEVLIDLYGDGVFETTIPIVGGNALVRAPSATGSLPIVVAGGAGRYPDLQTVLLIFNPDLVDEPDVYNLGGNNLMPSPQVAAAANFYSSPLRCQGPAGDSAPLLFTTVDYSGNPDQAVCDCGVGFRGTVVIDVWGTDLADPIVGQVYGGELVGDRNCGCTCCEDTDGDGQDDDWVAACARARVNITFTALVGSSPPVSP